MDKETKELFDALMKEFDRVEQKIYGRLNEMDNKLDTIQKVITGECSKKGQVRY